jgi:hypothetical protein
MAFRLQKKIIVLGFSLFMRLIWVSLDPDPDSDSQSRSGSNDPIASGSETLLTINWTVYAENGIYGTVV